MENKKTPRKRTLVTKPMMIRAPEELYNDVIKISRKLGISINAICLDILQKGVKLKLKELHD
jgi:hypothetical protein